MKRFFKGVCVLILFSSGLVCATAFGDEQSRYAKLDELMKVSGLYQMMDEARNQNKVQALKYKRHFMQQASDSFKSQDPAILEFIAAEYDKFVTSLEPKWTTQEAVRTYIELFGSKMTEEEIDKLLVFSKSEIGLKSTAITNEIVPLWFDYLTKDFDAQFGHGLQVLVANLQKFVSEKKAGNKAHRPHKMMPFPPLTSCVKKNASTADIRASGCSPRMAVAAKPDRTCSKSLTGVVLNPKT